MSFVSKGSSKSFKSAVPAGTRLNDIYEIDYPVAAGGMGEVYKGHSIETGEEVAIKMIRDDMADNDAVISLFRKEALSLRRLQHEAIIRYYVFAVEPTLKRPYLAMEYADGQSLGDLTKKQPLSYERAHDLVRRLASGLHAAHQLGIIHRDISPDNIILPDGDVGKSKIIDFGIAKSTKMGETTIIGDGFAGKYAYVSPEQLGLFTGQVSPQSDIYSLGLIIAEAMRGEPLDMGGSQVAIIEKRRKVPDLTGVDDRLRPLLEWMLEPDPKDRPETMADVIDWEDTHETSRSPMKMIGIAAAVVAMLGGGAYFMMQGGSGTAPQVAVVSPPQTQPQPTTPEIKLPPAVETKPVIASVVPPRPATVKPVHVPFSVEDRIERIKDYVRYFEGDNCLLLAPVAVSDNSATIEAFAADDAGVTSFENDFRQVNGFDAQTDRHKIAREQCPVSSFMRRLDADNDPGLVFDVQTPVVKQGQPVQAKVTGADKAVEILSIDEQGKIENLSSRLQKQADGLVLSSPLNEGRPNPSKSRLLLLISSEKPIDALRSDRPAVPGGFFTAALEEIVRNGQPVKASLRYVRVDG